MARCTGDGPSRALALWPTADPLGPVRRCWTTARGAGMTRRWNEHDGARKSGSRDGKIRTWRRKVADVEVESAEDIGPTLAT